MYVQEEQLPIAITIKRIPLKARPFFISLLKLRKVANAYGYAKDVFDRLDSGNPVVVPATFDRFEDGAIKEFDTSQTFYAGSDFGIFSAFIKDYYEIGNYMDWPTNFDNSSLKKGEELDLEYEVSYATRYLDWHGNPLPGTVFQSPEYLLDKEAEAWKETLTDRQKQYLEALTSYHAPCAPCGG